MQITPGTVVGGRVELDSDVVEGTAMTVLASEGGEALEADENMEKRLLDAIGQCERCATLWRCWSVLGSPQT